MDKILFYEGPWYFLSNFSSFAVHRYGSLWMTAEHAYQSAKFESPITRQLIHDARSAHDAKTIARVRKSDARSDWNSVKLAVMEEILRAKVEQHPYIRKKLIESGNIELVEDSPEDPFWGRGPDWEGENHLGQLWMKIRSEIRIL